MSGANKTYCTECHYFTDVVYDGEQWFGAKCKKDGHSTMPSMYAIKSLYDNCPLTEGGMTREETTEILEEVKDLDDSMYQYVMDQND